MQARYASACSNKYICTLSRYYSHSRAETWQLDMYHTHTIHHLLLYSRRLPLIYLLLIIILPVQSHLYGQTTVVGDELPYSPYLYQEIDQCYDTELQEKLDFLVASKIEWRPLVQQKRLAIGIVDLRKPSKIRYASINGDHMMYAASLPKIAVLLTAMECIADSSLQYDQALKKDLRLMIARSNNAATTRVIDKVGMMQIAKVMQQPEYALYDQNDGGGLWVGKRYAAAGIRNPEPIQGLSHAATVRQVCRFYTMLAYGQLVNEEMTQEMLKYLVDPKIYHKFVKALRVRAPRARVYRKSGSWRNYHADSALVYGEGNRRYIVVALIDDPNGSIICTEIISVAESALGIVNPVVLPK